MHIPPIHPDASFAEQERPLSIPEHALAFASGMAEALLLFVRFPLRWFGIGGFILALIFAAFGKATYAWQTLVLAAECAIVLHALQWLARLGPCKVYRGRGAKN